MADTKLDDAAVAALFHISTLPHAKRREFLSAIFGDELQRTEPITSGSRDRVNGSITFPRGSLRALVHNHPQKDVRDRNAEPNKFSDGDMALADRLGVPSYITTPDGTVRRYERGATTDVLAQFPIDEWRAYMMRELLNRAPDDPRGLKR